MSTASFDAPRPMRAVFTPTDAAETAQALADQKSCWAGFLTARDVLLGVWHAGTDRVSSLMERLHLSGALVMARRGLGWLLGGLERTSEGLRTPGVRPGLLWALTTAKGQQLAGRVLRPTLSGVRSAARWSFHAVVGVLHRLGTPGRKTADWLTAKAVAVKAFVNVRVRPVLEMASIVLSPSGLVVQAVNGWARARVLTAVVSRYLPRPWNILGRIVASYFGLPTSVRTDAMRLVGASVPPKFEEPEQPEDDPTPPATVTRLNEVRNDRQDDGAENDIAVNEAVHQSMQRHPAKRSPNAKKRR